MFDIYNIELEDLSYIGESVIVRGSTLDYLTEAYDKLIAELIYRKYKDYNDEDITKKYIAKLVNWLHSTDFYTAPASTRYHESIVGGLLVHTLNVYNNVIELRHSHQFDMTDLYSAVLVALVHDWCKIGLYEPYEKNVKNDKTGQWEKQIAFKVNQTGIPLGHGVASMFLANRFFRLTTEEALAIRWHMGRFRVCDDEINEFQLANEKYPLVHLIQFADQLSITDYANCLIQ